MKNLQQKSLHGLQLLQQQPQSSMPSTVFALFPAPVSQQHSLQQFQQVLSRFAAVSAVLPAALLVTGYWLFRETQFSNLTQYRSEASSCKMLCL